jgi:hypothetical protein
LFVQGGVRGHLNNLGETVTLRNPGGTIVSTLSIPPAPSDPQRFLVISEVMYHPEPNGDAEFVELMNISPSVTLDLSGVTFTSGIEFTFPAGVTLAPLDRILVVRNIAAFESAHGTGLPIAGEFANLSGLSNGGERLKLDDATGSTVREFAYDDSAPWPAAADGSASLVLIAPLTGPDPANPRNWRASTSVNGNPDGDDAIHFSGNPDADDDTDGWSNLVEYALGPDPQAAAAYSPAGARFTVSPIVNADDAEIGGEVSPALSNWTPADFAGTVNGTHLFRAPPQLPGEKRLFFRATIRRR